MEFEIDQQYQASLSAQSEAAQPSAQQIDTYANSIPALASIIDKPHNNDINNVNNHNPYGDVEQNGLDNLSLGLTDFDSDVETDVGENEPLAGHNNYKTSSHGHNHSNDDNGHGHSHGHDGSCQSKSPEQLALEAKLQEEQEALERQWDEDMKQYQTDPTLSGFIFNEDLQGFIRALNSGQYDIHGYDFKGEHTALHHAVFHEELEFIHELMRHGCDVNIRNFRGETPLMLASKLEDGLPILSLLIEKYGADIHAKDDVGLHAFHHSAEQGRVYHLSLLHTVYGVDVNVVDIYNKNALHWAGWAGHSRAVDWLLKHGCSPYARDHVGCYPLHWAAAKCRDQVVQQFVQFDASDGVNIGGVRTIAEQTYVKHVRKLRFGDKYNYVKSPFVLDSNSIQIDPKIPEQIKLSKRRDGDNINKYADNETYEDLLNGDSSYNSIERLSALRPSRFPDYKPFGEMLAVKNKDGLDVRAFALFKNENLTGPDRYYINNTVSLIDRYSKTALWSGSDTVRWVYNQVQRAGYLPFHFFVCYLIAILSVTHLFHPLYQQYFPEKLWQVWSFYLVWVFTMYNWYRIVFTTPGHLDFFTPATQSQTEGFGDDGSTNFVTEVPTLDENGNPRNDKNVNQGDIFNSNIKSDDCSTVAAGFCTFDVCKAPHHKNPIQKFTIKEYQSVSTLYTLFVDLMTTGKANESNTCYTCEIARPLRSKHCPRCNCCVPRFDHHCPFFNQDIAYTNYHNFLWFLILVPTNWVFLMIMFFNLSLNGLLTVQHIPTSFFSLVSFMSPSTAIVVFKFVIYHYILYVIFDLLLFGQHLMLLVEGLTTNEAMNRARYTYLQVSGVQWNPFSRGGFWTNFIAALGFHKWSREPLCMSDDQCKAIGYTPSPFNSSWANKLKQKAKRQPREKNNNTPNDV
jgi:ankyrin repeat protein